MSKRVFNGSALGNRPLWNILLWVLAVLVSCPGVAVADDVTPPEAPMGVVVEQGSDWRASDQFTLTWHNPEPQETPIVIAHYQLCPVSPLGPCTAYQATGFEISSVNLQLPHRGLFWVRVWLEDEAGNVDPNNRSSHATLRFDNQIPPAGNLLIGEEWRGRDFVSGQYRIEIPGDDWPMSGILGYSVTLDGSDPDGTVEVFATQDYNRFVGTYELPHLPEGTTFVNVRAVSNSGVLSGAIGTSIVRIDRSSPAVYADVPSSEQWISAPLTIILRGEDQAHLSGMGSASPGEPVENGGHLIYRLDGGAPVMQRGAEIAVAVDNDGKHVLAVQAVDVAGNASVEKEVAFKIDRTAPVGAFRALDAGDPRRVLVDVADATSGVADGYVEYRRSGGGEFERIPTVRDGGLLSARLDDEKMPAGDYELRAVVTDVAGNRATVDARADGTPMRLALPLRDAATLTVGAKRSAKECAKAARKVRGKRRARKRRPKKAKCPRGRGAAIPVRHGRRLQTSGRLSTASGQPIPRASIAVEGEARNGGGFARIGTVSTEHDGSFRFVLPPGPSRTVRYRYDGTNTIMPASGQLVTKVAAVARLKVNRRRVRNGQAVRFTGRLLGRPIPKAGKLVALQAKVGRRWRTFATPRAKANGVFRHRYRFTATTGTRRYAFRVVVAREDAYPYEAGTSRTIRVTVRGR